MQTYYKAITVFGDEDGSKDIPQARDRYLTVAFGCKARQMLPDDIFEQEIS